MNKKELITAVSEASGSRRRVVVKILESAFDVIGEKALEGEKVSIKGFGTFVHRDVPASDSAEAKRIVRFRQAAQQPQAAE